MNRITGLIHKLDADIINVIHNRNTSSKHKSTPGQKSYEAINAFKRGETVYVNNVEVLGFSNQAFLGADKIVPFNIVTSVTTIA